MKNTTMTCHGIAAALALVTGQAVLGTPPLKVGQPFPDIALPALADGAPRSIADFRGQKVILHIFASW